LLKETLEAYTLGEASEWNCFEHFSKYMFLYDLLNDEKSRENFKRVLKYRFSRSFLTKPFPPHDEKFFYECEQKRLNMVKDYEKLLSNNRGGYVLYETFVLEGYTYFDKNGGEVCGVSAGDVVLDCGAFIGDFGVYAADRTNNNVKVFAFEPSPGTYNALRENIEKYNYSNIIIPVNKGVFDEEDFLSFGCLDGLGARFSSTGEIKVAVTTIDNFVESNCEKVDFIKMDIEGAEAGALRGAAKTIQKYHPKLAICVYHKQEDFYDIPQTILAINPNYSFYLQHNGKGNSDTVLFAVPAGKPQILLTANPDPYIPFFNLVSCVYDRFLKDSKHYIFETIFNLIKKQTDIPFTYVFNDRYPYLAFGNNTKFHYEFSYSNGNIYVGLHFEHAPFLGDKNKCADIESLLDKIASKSKLYKFDKIPWFGFYALRCAAPQKTAESVSNVLLYLINISIQPLFENGLVDSPDIIAYFLKKSLIGG
jgi:FkbM family methyltransferase